MLRALGIVTCDACGAVIRIHARSQVWVRE
jgi:hypothetical protein